MTEQGAVSDNDIAVEHREAQRPTSLAARTPIAAILGNGDIAVGALVGREVRPAGRQPAVDGSRSAAPRRLPALHPLVGETETGRRATPRPEKTGVGAAERWLNPRPVIMRDASENKNAPAAFTQPARVGMPGSNRKNQFDSGGMT